MCLIFGGLAVLLAKCKAKCGWSKFTAKILCHCCWCKLVVALNKPPVPVHLKKPESTRSTPTVIVFDISAMDRPTIQEVKTALDREARQMIQTVEVPYELEELTKRSKDELKSLQCADVSVEIGKLAGCASWYSCFLLLFNVLSNRPRCFPVYVLFAVWFAVMWLPPSTRLWDKNSCILGIIVIQIRFQEVFFKIMWWHFTDQCTTKPGIASKYWINLK